VNDLKTDVYGNGHKGIKADVTKLKTDVQTLQSCKNKAKSFMAGIASPVIAALIVAFIFFLLNLYFQQKFDRAITEIQKT
jgi:hypothetical protein